MNIRAELLKYQVQSRVHSLRIAEYAISSEVTFAEMMRCFFSDETRLAQRAAWCVDWINQHNPDFLEPYIDSLVQQLERPDSSDAMIRNSLRILEDRTIPEIYHGTVLNHCFDFIQKRDIPVAIKAFSLQIVFELSKNYPDIRSELKWLIQENIEYETAAFRSRGKKILGRL